MWNFSLLAQCYLFLVLYRIITVSFNVFLWNFIFFFFFFFCKRTFAFFNSNWIYPIATTGRRSVKRCSFLRRLHVADIGWAVLHKKVNLTGNWDKNGFIFQQTGCSRAMNKVKTALLCRILNYLTEHLQVPAFVRDREEKHHLSFSLEASKYHKGITLHYFIKLCKSLPEYIICRSSSPEVFFKKGVLRNFVKFTGKRLWMLRNFKNTFSYRTPPVAASEFARVLLVYPSIIIKNTSIYKANF